MRRTSQQWWNETKASPETLLAWLRKQYHGEVTAALRIESYCIDRLDGDDERLPILRRIAADERRHAGWVGDLLRARGEEPKLLVKEERYWRETMPGATDFVTAAAVAHLAEKMRLERIEVIAVDEGAPEDVREVFGKILKDERFHAGAFGQMAGGVAIEAALGAHLRGTDSIGFTSATEAL
jgi:rubrerythrin